MLDFIYSVKDKRTGEVGYIGVTNHPNARLKQHIKGLDGNNKKDKWFQSIDPDMEILEVIRDNRKHAFIRERYWIQKYLADGAQLINVCGIKPARPVVKKVRTPPPPILKKEHRIPKEKASSRAKNVPKSDTPKKARVKKEDPRKNWNEDDWKRWRQATKKVMAERAETIKAFNANPPVNIKSTRVPMWLYREREQQKKSE